MAISDSGCRRQWFKENNGENFPSHFLGNKPPSISAAALAICEKKIIYAKKSAIIVEKKNNVEYFPFSYSYIKYSFP